MRRRFHICTKVAAMCGIMVLLAAGTARLLHTSGNSSHKYGKAVSEVSSTLSDHLLQATPIVACAVPSLEFHGPVAAQEKSLPSHKRPLLRRLRGRAPPASS
jgi:hypothetical protein